jgi:hypothetical protein
METHEEAWEWIREHAEVRAEEPDELWIRWRGVPILVHPGPIALALVGDETLFDTAAVMRENAHLGASTLCVIAGGLGLCAHLPTPIAQLGLALDGLASEVRGIQRAARQRRVLAAS